MNQGARRGGLGWIGVGTPGRSLVTVAMHDLRRNHCGPACARYPSVSEMAETAGTTERHPAFGGRNDHITTPTARRCPAPRDCLRAGVARRRRNAAGIVGA